MIAKNCKFCGNKKIYAKNKCRKCYMNNYNPPYYIQNKSKIKEVVKKWRCNNIQKVREYDRIRNRIRNKNPDFRLKNRDRLRIWRKNNPEKNLEYDRKYRIKFKEKRYKENKEYIQKRIKIDKDFCIKDRLRKLLIFALKKYTKIGKIMSSKKYGVNYQEIIESLKPFPKNISEYHIDHIQPLCSFDFINTDGSTNLEEVRKAFAPENHQWLLAEENLRKGGKWIAEQKNIDILCV